MICVCFPTPADDFLNGLLELPRRLAPNSSATFAWAISSNSMCGAGIFDRESAVVDRSLKPGNGSVVIAIVDGTKSLMCLPIEGRVVRLAFNNPEGRSSSFSTGRTGCF